MRIMHRLRTNETLRSSDLILAGLIVLTAIVLFWVPELLASHRENRLSIAGKSVIVEVCGTRTHTIPISEVSGSSVVTVRAGADVEAILEILETGKVRVMESTCRDKICVRTGWIRRPGQAIVCLPNRIVVRLEGSEISDAPESPFDAITY